MRNRRELRRCGPGRRRADAGAPGPPRPGRHRLGHRERPRVARPHAPLDRRRRGRTAAALHRGAGDVARRQRRDLQPRGRPADVRRADLLHALRQRGRAAPDLRARRSCHRRAERDVRVPRGEHRRSLHRGTRPGRHQAAVLGASRGRHPVRLGDARLRRRMAAAGRVLPARPLLDPRRGARALRARGARRRAEAVSRPRLPGHADARRHAARDPRGPRELGRPADDGRRRRRRLPVRRAGFVAGRRDRRRLPPCPRQAAADLRRRHRAQRRSARGPSRRRAHRQRAPRADLHRDATRARAFRRSCA